MCLGKALLLTGLVAWLFYRSVTGMVILPILWLILCVGRRKEQIKQQQRRIREQFKECIRLVTTSLYAGYSVENAFAEAEKELVQLLGTQADMCRELHGINQQLKLNVPVELMMQGLARRSGVEEIASFGQVFGYAKRSGSDFSRILKDTVKRIGEKIELERELQTLIAAKRLEQRIMNIIPLGILLFVNLTSPEFLEMMYEGLLGRTIMSIFLLIYGGAYLLSVKIVNIKI